MSNSFLDKTYDLDTPEETRSHYDKWAESYDREIAENGYATPGRVADALWQFLPEPDTEVLDYGCGTGLCGQELKRVGFHTVDGMDLSADMIDSARAKGIYRRLEQISLDDPQPSAQDRYRAVAGAGLLGVGGAPPDVFDLILHALPRQGLFAFSLNDHALADPAYTSKISEWVDCAAAHLLFREYGPHLPGIDLKSDVYVIKKA
ncbi:methyltransferase domain-containing protein [Rhodobacteraceae bacterium M382]|nr:methyltransferase domain-containing protein [Rhodobacteraceae bacterium M382]